MIAILHYDTPTYYDVENLPIRNCKLKIMRVTGYGYGYIGRII